MKCELEITNLTPENAQVFEKGASSFLSNAFEQVATQSSDVGMIIIASEDRIHPVIQSLKPYETIKVNQFSGLISGGITIPRRCDNQTVTSDIVFGKNIFTTLISDSNKYDLCRLDAFYTICHEFGHAKDFGLRNETVSIITPTLEPPSPQTECDLYGTTCVITEFIAAHHSKCAVSNELFRHHCEMTNVKLQSLILQLRQYPHLIPRMLSLLPWTVLAEIARLYGEAGTQAMIDSVIQIERYYLADASLFDVLKNYLKQYPCWNAEEQRVELIELFRTVAARVLGVKNAT